jgi:membrane fusion protein (multidrug efflux system)
MTTSSDQAQTLTTGIAVGPRPQAAAARRQRRPLRQLLRLPLMLGVPLVAALAGGYFYVIGGRYVSTDDAYVQAARVSISTDVPGRVVAVAVRDNQPVKAGDLLFKLDDRPFAIAVQDARAQLASARLKVDADKATYRQRRADLQAAQDTLAYQQHEFERQQRLLASGIASQAQYDQVAHAFDVARQQLGATQQQVASILANLGGDADIPVDQHPSVQQAQAVLDRALLNLSYTVVKAPEDGTVTKVDQLQPGDYVNAATPVFSLVSSRRLWIEANFKETDLTHMLAGQTATVDIDTYPDRVFHAHVASFSPGTGSTFSLLPPENATGNWVKVVQRLPVRLEIDNLSADTPLHAGLSADVAVDTHHQRDLAIVINHAFAAAKPAESHP